MVPAGGDEAGLRTPAHREGFAAVEHPRKVDTIVELRSEIGDLRVIEVGAGGEDSAEEDRGIDGGHFDVDKGLPGLDVIEMVEEAVLVWHLVEMEVERGDYLFFYAIGRGVAPLVGNTECCEAETSRGDAGGEMSIELARRGLVGGAVENLPCGRVGLLGEVEASCALHLLQEGQVFVA